MMNEMLQHKVVHGYPEVNLISGQQFRRDFKRYLTMHKVHVNSIDEITGNNVTVTRRIGDWNPELANTLGRSKWHIANAKSDSVSINNIPYIFNKRVAVRALPFGGLVL